MKYKVLGDSDCPLAEIDLSDGSSIKLENGCMAYMQDVNLEGRMNTEKKGFKGFMSAVGRSLTSGENFFISTAYGTGSDARIGIAPAIPGKIVCLKVGDQQYRLNTGAFLACDDSVNYDMKRQELGKAVFAGTGGLFVMETRGEGDVLVSAFGDLLELEVRPGKELAIDNEHVVAWDASLSYDIAVASGTFGFKTGEGLVNRFNGSGRVWIQTRNIHSLADAIRVFIPTQSSN